MVLNRPNPWATSCSFLGHRHAMAHQHALLGSNWGNHPSILSSQGFQISKFGDMKISAKWDYFPSLFMLGFIKIFIPNDSNDEKNLQVTFNDADYG